MRKTVITVLAVVAAGLEISQAADAATFQTLHGFCAKTDCADGQQSRAPLASDGAGNYYGTTTGGGTHQGGVIFRLHFDGAKWTYARLHNFCTKADCTDGNFPQGGVVVDTAGNLYGMTSVGGAHSQGEIYRLSPNGTGWTFRVLHSFCNRTDCTDGSDPLYVTLSYQGQASGVLYDGTSPLYGTTNGGGMNAEGTVFAFTPDATGGTYDIVYNFCRKTECIDGAQPGAGVTADAMGNLYGAAAGGVMHSGIVFELTRSGSLWTQTVLHDFCGDFDGTHCLDGMTPFAPPVMDGGGNLYGTTGAGGAHDQGTAYKIVPDGIHSKFTALHSFCAEAHCADGAVLASGLTLDGSGHLFGVTLQGGVRDQGTLFELSGAKFATFTTLETFKLLAQGASPIAGLMLAPSGALLGTLQSGGRKFGGVVFSVTP